MGERCKAGFCVLVDARLVRMKLTQSDQKETATRPVLTAFAALSQFGFDLVCEELQSAFLEFELYQSVGSLELHDKKWFFGPRNSWLACPVPQSP